jgi:hypothetical protein
MCIAGFASGIYLKMPLLLVIGIAPSEEGMYNSHPSLLEVDMSKAFLAPIGIAACAIGVALCSSPALAGAGGALASSAKSLQPAKTLTTVTYRRYYYGWPSYGYAPRAYGFYPPVASYYYYAPPPAVYYVPPVRRYYAPPVDYYYDEAYVVPRYRRGFYIGW